MKKLELTKGLSFSTMNFACRKGEPFCVDDKKAKQLLSTGRFKLLGTVEAKQKLDEKQSQVNSVPSQNNNGEEGKEPENAGGGDELSAEVIDKMKKDELVALAEKEGIDLKDCANNEERIEKIKEALGFVSSGSLAFEE